MFLVKREEHYHHNHYHQIVMSPQQFSELRALLEVLIVKSDALLVHAHKQELLMADNNQIISDLTNVVAALGTGFTSLDSAVQAEIAAVNALIASSGGTLTPDQVAAIQTATTNISTIVNKMASDAASLTASIPAAPNTPAPAPAPTQPVDPTVTPPAVAPVTPTATDATPAPTDPSATAPQPASGGNQPAP